jgi:hypothetical protein
LPITPADLGNTEPGPQPNAGWQRKKENKMSFGKALAWGSLSAILFSMYYFREDAQRYMKMRMM